MSAGSSPITIGPAGEQDVRAFAALIHEMDNYY
jgi:hypothetical protein